MVKAGLLVFSETMSREGVYKQRKPLQDRERDRFIATLKDEICFLVPSHSEIRSKRDIREAVAEVNASDVAAVVLYIPIFVSPALVAHAARMLRKPLVLTGNRAPDTLSQLGQLAAGGAMDQIGISYQRLPGGIDDPTSRNELVRYLRVIETSEKLIGTTFGCIGGRSLGIGTNIADLAQWERLFGVDIEHVDQYEIVLRASRMSKETVLLYKKWIRDMYGAVNYNKEGRFDEERLDKMIRSYLAVKSIVQDYELDFVGIKCQPELSNGYVLQCLTVQLLNDPYDAEGPKEPIACSCEADNDGALTMQILKMISGGLPTALQDIIRVDDSSLVIANCGSTASYFAGLSDEPAENLREVFLIPHGFGEAGGAATQFVAASGLFTYARLFRREGKYHMAVLKGETEKRPRESLNDYAWYKPTSFVHVDLNSEQFLREYGSNHIHCVRGDLVAELVEFCEYKGIPYTIY
jgi:L-fucose isomerase